MMLKCPCPKCGQSNDYISEQVGQTAYCNRCGHAFTLRGQPAKVALHIALATLVVVGGVVGVFARAYHRAHRNDRDRPTITFNPYDDDDER
ncbi:MAG: hypothetical protein U0746_06970 [Gemmataceae bacterium]